MSKRIKILVASTVYGYQDQLSAIYAQLDGLGYEVMNSFTYGNCLRWSR
jgi:hypothetical protein